MLDLRKIIARSYSENIDMIDKEIEEKEIGSEETKKLYELGEDN